MAKATYLVQTLLSGNLLDTTLEKSSIDFQGITLHLNGRLIAGNRAWEAKDEIAHLALGAGDIYRPSWSDTVAIKTRSGDLIGLRYIGLWPFGEWQRLIPMTDPPEPIHGEPPSRMKRACWTCFEIAFGALGLCLHLLTAALEGWTGKSAR
jgi:hypothetical protein